jgi:uncharacterized membrane protein
MKARTLMIVIFVLFALSVAIGLAVYPRMPEQVVTHWNSQGQPNGYMPRFWGVFFMPIIMIAIAALMYFLPFIDPLRSNVSAFRSTYNLIIAFMAAFLFYIGLLSLVWNLGFTFPLERMMVPAFALLSYAMGALLGKAKRNWFIGIRTPWTLSSDAVWNKTHQRAGLLFKLAAPVTLLGLISSEMAAIFMVGPLVLVSIYVVAYSYVVYKQEQNSAL